MGIADPEAALEKLREFRRLQEQAESCWPGDAPQATQEAIDKMEPLVERIARALDTVSVLSVSGAPRTAIATTNRLMGILEKQEDFQQIFGHGGPTLAANQLHPWVWNAVASLWGDGRYEPAVHEAAKAVELHTQLKVGRRDLSGKKLYSTAFAKDDPIPGGARLRFRHIDRSERPDAWTSAHEGAQHLGMGCAQGIRNPRAHPSENISEQAALEQLAALSVLARWVTECEVVNAPAVGSPRRHQGP